MRPQAQWNAYDGPPPGRNTSSGPSSGRKSIHPEGSLLSQSSLSPSEAQRAGFAGPATGRLPEHTPSSEVQRAGFAGPATGRLPEHTPSSEAQRAGFAGPPIGRFPEHTISTRGSRHLKPRHHEEHRYQDLGPARNRSPPRSNAAGVTNLADNWHSKSAYLSPPVSREHSREPLLLNQTPRHPDADHHLHPPLNMPEIMELVQAEVEVRIMSYRVELAKLAHRVAKLEAPGPTDATETKLNSTTDPRMVAESEETMEPVQNPYAYSLMGSGPDSRESPDVELQKEVSGGQMSRTTNASSAEDEDQELPCSIFCYCMTVLPTSDRFWTNPALFFLFLDVCLQQILLIALTDSAILLSLTNHWHDGFGGDEDKFDCTFSDGDNPNQIKSRLILGKPLIEFLVGSAAIYVTASSIALDDRETLGAVRQSLEGRLSLQIVLNVAWFVCVVYQPAVFAVGAANIFANSQNSLDIVMNAVAVSFILDIDDVMYEILLDERSKRRYQMMATDAVRYPEKTIYHFTWIFFVVSWLVMMFLFARLHAKHAAHGEDYYDLFFHGIRVTDFLIVVPAIRSVVHYLAHSHASGAHETASAMQPLNICSFGCHVVAVVFGGGGFAKVLGLAMHNLFSPGFHNKELLNHCLN